MRWSRSVRHSISEMTPVAPDQINRKIHPALSQVIMKALSKAPEERYQSGQDLVNDLERCKESASKAAAAAKPGQAAPKAPAAQKPAPAVSAPPAKPASPAMTPQPNPTFKPVAPAPPLAAKAAAAGRSVGS